MSVIITSTSANPYYVNDAVTYVDNASNIVAYTGSTGQTGTGHIVNPVF
jgi:hypothetical protein